MGKVRATSSIRPRALRATLSRAERDFRKQYEAWQDTYPGLRKRLSDPHREHFDALGRTLFRFDLRYRWAVGVSALELDDQIVTKATTAATKQGYFLLMRLVDLWFSLDLAFALYAASCVPSHVAKPSLIESLRRDSETRLRAAKAAAASVNAELEVRFRKKDARERLAGWVLDLSEHAEPGRTSELAREGAGFLAKRARVGPEHLISTVCLVRNAYVHGGETASSRGLPAQEKVPVLKLLSGFTAISALSLADAGVSAMQGRPARLARF